MFNHLIAGLVVVLVVVIFVVAVFVEVIFVVGIFVVVFFIVSSLQSYSFWSPSLHTIHVLFQNFLNMYVSQIIVDLVDSLLYGNSDNMFYK